MKRKIFVVGPAKGYANWMQGELVDRMEDCDLVVFTGGEDVNPLFYDNPKHPTTFFNTKRDEIEIHAFNKAMLLSKHVIGICRGAQLLCVCNGGILVQDQPGAGYIHPIQTYDEQVIPITSTHHQAAYPFILQEDEYKVLAWGPKLTYHKNGNDDEMSPAKECEIVYYPKTKCLGIQGHPEGMFSNPKYESTINYVQNLLDKFMANSI